MRGPVGTIRVERHGQAMALEHRAQRAHDGRDAFAPLAQLGVEHVLGGVVDDDDHRQPLLGHEGQPLMPTAVEV